MSGRELDLRRLAELQALLGRDMTEIVSTLLGEFTRAFAELDAALAEGDLSAASGAAHAARNSALMIDAAPMLDGLRWLETCARASDLAGARRASGELRPRWDRVRSELQAAAA